MNIVNTIRNALTATPTPQGSGNGSPQVVSIGGGGQFSSQPEVEARVNKTRKRERKPYEGFGHVSASSKLVQRVIELSGVKVVSDSDRDKLVELDEQFQQREDWAAEYTRPGAERAYEKQQASLRERLKAGKFKEAAAEDSWTEQDWAEDYKAKAAVAHDEMRRVCGEASEITLRIRDQVAKAATAATRILEAELAERAERYGMPVLADNVLIATGQLQWNLDWIPVCRPGATWPRPNEILKTIDGIYRQ